MRPCIDSREARRKIATAIPCAPSYALGMPDRSAELPVVMVAGEEKVMARLAQRTTVLRYFSATE
jgi:hypothetical protein